MAHDNDWLLVEVATGLQKLACLSLDRTPAAEMLAGTAQAWMEAITYGRTWNERRDAHRVQAAFRTLARTVRRWPAPSEFLDALPRVEQAAIGYEVKPVPPDEAAKILARLREQVENAPPLETKPAGYEPRPALAATEADLRHHYDRKRATGGDA